MTKGQANNLNHQQARYFLDVGRDQLVTAEQRALDSHLSGCVECRHYAAEVADLQNHLAQTMRRRWQNHHPSPVIKAQVQARLRRKIWQRQVWRFANSVAAIVVILLGGIALGWLAWRTRPLPDTPAARITLAAPASPQLTPPVPGEWLALPGLTTFGDQAKLLGYSLSTTSFVPGDTVNLSLYGQTHSSDVTFFAHLLDSGNNLVTQAAAAKCRQVSQHSADLVVTCVSLPLPNTLSTGSYQLRVGVYDQASSQRLTTPTGEASLLLTSLQIGLLPTPTPLPLPTLAPTPTPYPIPANCPVTLPNGNPPPGQPPSPNYHGNGQLWTHLLPGGVPVPPENVRPDGKLTYNWWWWRGQTGQLTITGRQLDDLTAPPLEAEITPRFGNSGYQDSGYQDSWLIFPGEGCWEVTGQVGDATLTFVTWVVNLDQ